MNLEVVPLEINQFMSSPNTGFYSEILDLKNSKFDDRVYCYKLRVFA